MPFYEYRCDNCEHELEALQKVSDPPLVECPVCGQSSLKRLISAVSFRLKGSGWYETDFKKSGKRNLHDSGTKEGRGGAETKEGHGGADDKASGAKSETGGAKSETGGAKSEASGSKSESTGAKTETSGVKITRKPSPKKLAE